MFVVFSQINALELEGQTVPREFIVRFPSLGLLLHILFMRFNNVNCHQSIELWDYAHYSDLASFGTAIALEKS